MEPKGSLPYSQCLSPVPILSQINPDHATSQLNSWRSILILSSHLRLGLPSCLFTSGFPTKTLYTPLLSPIRATCITHLILLDFITPTIFLEQYRSLSSLSSSLCNFLHSPVTSSVFDPTILLSTLFSNTLRLRSSPNISDQVSYPYKIKGKITVLYILIFKLSDGKLKDKRFCTEWQQAFPDFNLLTHKRTVP